MVEAGAAEVPEEKLLEAFDIAHAEIRALRGPGGSAPAGRQAEVARPRPHGGARQRPRRSHPSGISSDGLREGAAAVVELVEELFAAHDRLHRGGHRSRDAAARARRAILERRRVEAVLGPVREQFEDELRVIEAEQDSKQLLSAKRALLYDNIIESVELPFPVGPATVEGEPRP